MGTLVPVDGTMDSTTYINTLNNQLSPDVARHFGNRPWIFHEDNVPCHVSRASNNWKTENNIVTIKLPPQSPDLNVIENVWRTLKISLEKRLNEIKTKDDLIRVVTDIWTTLTIDYIQELYSSLPRRISAVRKSKVYITKF